MPKTLKDVFDLLAHSYEYQCERAFKFLDVAVVAEYNTCPCDNDEPDTTSIYYHPYKSWIGIHKNVHFWVELANGYAVGMNENPARGITFPGFPALKMRAAFIRVYLLASKDLYKKAALIFRDYIGFPVVKIKKSRIS